MFYENKKEETRKISFCDAKWSPQQETEELVVEGLRRRRGGGGRAAEAEGAASAQTGPCTAARCSPPASSLFSVYFPLDPRLPSRAALGQRRNTLRRPETPPPPHQQQTPRQHQNTTAAPQHQHKKNLTIGLLLPKTMFGVRGYNRAINEAVNSLHRSKGPKLEFLKHYTFTPHQVRSEMMLLTPSPTGVWSLLVYKSYCEERYIYNGLSALALTSLTRLRWRLEATGSDPEAQSEI
ncbi:hypothetical protein AAG570_013567 [Ranatra chinensis]|uniref:Uncharacterized protein n=1 Tax=Ranatra chinensis TaxID=642074 RepID=A0ABD0YCK3_9HEMI